MLSVRRFAQPRGLMRAAGLGAALGIAAVLAGCTPEIPAHLKPIPEPAIRLMGERGMEPGQPIFIRIFKAESELEVWKKRDDGRFYHFKTYPICNWSGDLGPKLKQGDRQAPEGFYVVGKGQMNPNSSFHLSFNLGYPNRYDRANGRTGQFLMVHGDCKSAGCYAMTDALVEEIYALAREAFDGGQKRFEVHAFPFRMTEENIQRHRDHKWARFWSHMRPAYDIFNATRIPPKIAICERRYLVNVAFLNGRRPASASAACPAYRKLELDRFDAASPAAQQTATLPPVKSPGRKVRQFASVMSLKPEPRRRPSSWGGAFGLTRSSSATNRSWWGLGGGSLRGGAATDALRSED